MFENIIGQTQVVQRLSTETRERILPPALLFHGPDYSGKSSVALELARVLTCTGADPGVPWGCRCTSCTQQRHLMQPETLLIGGRYFAREISVAASALKRDDRLPHRFLFERAVRKLTRRYDPVLWEGEETRVRKVEPLLEQLDDALAPYLPDSAAPTGERFVKGIDTVLGICEKLVGVQTLDAVPVAMVRRLSAWSRIAASGRAKVAIIENVDRLGESARNALLKTLEEPSASVTFVLTTQRRGAVIATIQSRARAYGFLTRGPQESSQVIARIFRDDTSDAASIRDYFMRVDGRALRPLAERFVEGCLGDVEIELGLLSELEQTIASLGRNEGFRYFAEELSELFRLLLKRPGIAPRRLVEWRTLLMESSHRVEALNMQPSRVLEALYYGMRRSNADQPTA